jgi:hypothetical protein
MQHVASLLCPLPSCLIFSSQGATATTLTSGLTPPILLQPFANVANVSVPLRTPHGTLSIHDFGLNCVWDSDASLAAPLQSDAQLTALLGGDTKSLPGSPALSNTADTTGVLGPGNPGLSSPVPSASPLAASPLSHPLADLTLKRAEDCNEWVDRKDVSGSDVSPWFTRYRMGLQKTSYGFPFEMLSCPVAAVVLASTRDPDPLTVFRHYTELRTYPLSFQAGAYDADIPRFFVLLQDLAFEKAGQELTTNGGGLSTDGSVRRDAAAIFRDMKTMFPPSHCFLLPINSLATPSTSQPDIWAAYLPVSVSDASWNRVEAIPPLSTASKQRHAVAFEALVTSKFAAPARGCNLSGDDLLALSSAMSKIIIEGVIPALETRVMSLHASTAVLRRGLRDTLRSWLGGGSTAGPSGMAAARTVLPNASVPPSLTTEDASDVITAVFPLSSYENQMRQLADITFLLGDYEQALGLYRRLREELKPEKVPTWFASVSEMVVVCQIVLALTCLANPPACLAQLRDADTTLESASNYYYKAASAAQAIYGSPMSPSSSGGGEGSPPTASTVKRLAIRLATRASALYVDLLTCISRVGLPAGLSSTVITHRMRDMAGALRRVGQAEGDGSLASALFTEQAALAFLRARPSNFRKAAHMFATAGGFFATAGQPLHAVRCLSVSMTGYGSRADWRLVEDHLLLSLSQKLASLGDYGTACGFLSNVLCECGSSKLSTTLQRGILREFYRCYVNWMSRQPSLEHVASHTWSQVAKELTSPRLPSVDTSALAVTSFSNAWAAALFAELYTGPATVECLVARQAAKALGEKLGLSSIASSSPLSPVATHLLQPLPETVGTAVKQDASTLSLRAGVGDVLLPVGALETLPGCSGILFDKPISFSPPLQLYLPWSICAGEDLNSGSLPGEGLPWTVCKSPPSYALSCIASCLVSSAAPGILGVVAPLTNVFAWLATQQASLQTDGVACVAESISQLLNAIPSQHHPHVWSALLLAGRQAIHSFPAYSAWKANTSPVGLSAWNRLESLALREARELDRSGADHAELALGDGQDWMRLCQELAVIAEDEAEQQQRSHASTTSGESTVCGVFGAVDSDGDWKDNGEHTGYVAFPSVSSGADEAARIFDPASLTSTPSNPVSLHPSYHSVESVSKVQERIVGEPVVVSFALTNPLAIELPLLGLHLTGQWLDGKTSDEPLSSVDSRREEWFLPQDDTQMHPGEVVANGFAVVPIDICLQPNETRIVRLAVRPLRCGTCQVRTLKWLLAGIVPCRHDLDVQGPPIDARPPRAKRAVDRRLEWKVTEGREWLGVQLEWQSTSNAAIPTWYDGEVRTALLHLQNFGHTAVEQVWLRYQGKGRVYVGVEGGEDHLLQPAGLHANAIKLPVKSIAPGERSTVKLHMRVQTPGNATLRLLFHYGGLHDSTSHAKALAAMRTLRWVSKIRIQPSVHVTAYCSPSLSLAGDYDVYVDVTHVGASLRKRDAQGVIAPPALTVVNIACINSAWHAEPVSQRSLVPGSVASSLVLSDGEPLAFREARRFQFRLTQTAVKPDEGHSRVLKPSMYFLASHYAFSRVESEIEARQLHEHESRRAANAAQSLPPTLRTIARDREAKEAVAASTAAKDMPFRSALCPPRSSLHLLVSWQLVYSASQQNVSGTTNILALQAVNNLSTRVEGRIPKWLQVASEVSPPTRRGLSIDTVGIAATVHTPPTVRWNDTFSFQTFPVTIVLYHYGPVGSEGLSGDVHLGALGPSNTPPLSSATTTTSGDHGVLQWVGKATIPFVGLMPGCRTVLRATAAVFQSVEAYVDVAAAIRVITTVSGEKTSYIVDAPALLHITGESDGLPMPPSISFHSSEMPDGATAAIRTSRQVSVMPPV